MKILLFGATGSAGSGVLAACLKAPVVSEVRAITRKPLQVTDAKLRNVLHSDYLDYGAVSEAFAGVDACFSCLGVSVTQVSNEEYKRVSHDFAMAAAARLMEARPAAAFHYITGRGTNVASRMFWARVKGQTELDLMSLCGAVCWRPAFIDAPPTASQWFVRAMYPALRLLKPFPSMYVHGEDLGKAMIVAAQEGMRKRVVENPEIREMAGRAGF
jgi:uncharacterized protein YbjT (DUF2867 family)